MSRRKRSADLSRTRALVRLEPDEVNRSAPETDLAALLERLADLESATLSLSESLGRFRDERRARLGAAEEELFAARRLDDRLSRLLAEAREWDAGVSRTATARASRKRRPAPPAPWLPPPAAPAAEPWMPLKDLYRAIVRLVHPDRATTEADRAQKSEFLARVNAAYAREDRVLLELLFARAGSPAAPEDVEIGELTTHAERRLATLAPLVASLEKELGRLRASSLFRDLEAKQRAADGGGDYFRDALARLHGDSKALLARTVDRAVELEGAVRAFPRRDRAPVAGNGELLLRKAVTRVEKLRATEESLRFETDLEKRASTDPWQVVLSLFAFFAEVSVEPPPGLATLAAMAHRYEQLRVGWCSAPTFDRALLQLPPFLELGLHAYPKRLGFGLQLKHGWALGSIARALCTPELSSLARRVLEVVGPAEPCSGCGETSFFVHLHRTRGIGDDVHGLVCPKCAAAHRSYRTFGSPLGLEALAPYAVALGLVDEQAVRIADATLVFGLTVLERKELTAKRLLERVAALHFNGLPAGLSRYVRFREGRNPLSPSSRVQRGAKVRLLLAKGAPIGEKELIALLRARGRARYSSGAVNDPVVRRAGRP